MRSIVKSAIETFYQGLLDVLVWVGINEVDLVLLGDDGFKLDLLFQETSQLARLVIGLDRLMRAHQRA